MSFSLGHLVSSNTPSSEIAEEMPDDADSAENVIDELADMEAGLSSSTKAESDASGLEIIEEPPVVEEEDSKVVALSLDEPPAEGEEVKSDIPLVIKSFDERGKTFIPVDKKVDIRKKRIKRKAKPVQTAKAEKMEETTVSAPVLPPLPKGAKIKNGQQAKLESKPLPKVKKIEPLSSASIPKNAKFTIRVKTFPMNDDAEKLKAELLNKGYHAYVFKDTSSRRTWHLVNIGGYIERDAAEEVYERLKTEGYSRARVDRYRKR